MIISKGVEDLLLKTSVTLNALKNDQVVKEAIAELGYEDSHLDATITVRSTLEGLYRDLIALRGDQTRMGIQVQDKFQAAYKQYSHVFSICKDLFKSDRSTISQLGLGDYRKTSTISSFVARATRLYQSIRTKTDIKDAIAAAVGIDDAFFAAELLSIGELETLHREHVRLQGENQRLTLDRDKLLAQFRAKMNNLRSVLRMRFEDENMQTLERLGIFVRNRPKVKKPAQEPADTEPADTSEPAAPVEPSDHPEPESGARVSSLPIPYGSN